MSPFTSSMQHLLAEMERIDLLIQMQVWQARQSQILDNNFAGLVLTDTEIDHYLTQAIGAPRWVQGQDIWTSADAQHALQSLTDTIEARKQAARANNILLRLDLLQAIFGLSDEAVHIVLICLAPELDSRYGLLYAYLQNDVNQKHPTIDLVLNLLCATFEQKIKLRQWLDDTSPLMQYRVLHHHTTEQHHHFLTMPLKVDARIINYLLESDHPDANIESAIDLTSPDIALSSLVLATELTQQITRLSQLDEPMNAHMTLYFQGKYGIGRQTVASALCTIWQRRLLVVDTAQIIAHNDFSQTVRLILREALLTGSILYWEGIDTLFTDDKSHLLAQFLQQFDSYRAIIFMSGEQAWQPRNMDTDRQFLHLAFTPPEFDARVRLWERLLDHSNQSMNLPDIANNFRFTAGQIKDAIATAIGLARIDNPQNPRITHSHLQQACRLQSNRRLSTLAQPISGKYTWDDIILPPAQKGLLIEIHNQVRHRWRVYHDWGFDQKLSLGKGLNILFAGPSGTGKTMAAEIISKALGFDLYKIDLSTVISKYIGETEKHLAQIFDEAQSSNAILFFDEADAIFGKRSEVSDAQDRFANIQVSFLLQRMEEYDGIVVLTTNLRKNMDEAFVRRMQFIVEFPFPDVQYRAQMWRNAFPKATPLDDDVNWDYLAQRFELTGGNIRNIALAAAFFAVEDDQSVTMTHLLRAIQREFQKMGKIITQIDDYSSQR